MLNATVCPPESNALHHAPLVAGREQQIDAVLDVSFWRSNGKIRVTARLLRVQDGMPLWADQYKEFYTDDLTIASTQTRDMGFCCSELSLSHSGFQLTRLDLLTECRDSIRG